MLPNYKNTIFDKFFFLILAFFVFYPITVLAFSVGDLFNFLVDSSSSENVSPQKQESLQTLKVFEPNKVYAEENKNISDLPKLVKETSLSFEPNKDFTDDFSGNITENHGDNSIYTVQKGDSIYSIASYFNVSVETILSFNHLTSKVVHVGDILEIPNVSGVYYQIQKGDTLASISKKYNVDPDDVSLYGGFQLNDILAVGDEVFLPGAKEISKTSRTVSFKKPRGKQWANGDTEHLNTQNDIQKYSLLPKYEGYYLFPVPGAVRTQKMHGHNGVDLASHLGSPVLAAADGVVSAAKTGGYNFGYGNYIKITHNNGSETIYAHLLRVDVSVGQTVSRGQQIALLGSTGNSTGPHLHFEVRGAYNPFAW